MIVVLLCNPAQTKYNLLVPRETPNCEVEFKTAIKNMLSKYDHDEAEDDTFQTTETQESVLSIDSDIICPTTSSSMTQAHGDTLSSILVLEKIYKVKNNFVSTNSTVGV